MIRRREFIAGLGGAATWPVVGFAAHRWPVHVPSNPSIRSHHCQAPSAFAGCACREFSYQSGQFRPLRLAEGGSVSV